LAWGSRGERLLASRRRPCHDDIGAIIVARAMARRARTVPANVVRAVAPEPRWLGEPPLRGQRVRGSSASLRVLALGCRWMPFRPSVQPAHGTTLPAPPSTRLCARPRTRRCMRGFIKQFHLGPPTPAAFLSHVNSARPGNVMVTIASSNSMKRGPVTGNWWLPAAALEARRKSCSWALS
jgi:hypothetical protein